MARMEIRADGIVLRPWSDDDLEALTAALDACAGADVIIFSGGSSVGARDLIVDANGSRIVELTTGKEGFDFLGFHLRKVESWKIT